MTSSVYQIGISRQDITPAPGVRLCGYTVREGFSTDVHLPLTVTALVAESLGVRVAVVGVDAALGSVEFVDHVRDRCAAAIGTSRDHVLVNLSHTHSAPSPAEFMPFDSPDSIQRLTAHDSRVLDGCVKACKDAASKLQPARLAIGTGQCAGNINRRQATPEGEMLLGEDPAGPCDQTVRVARFDDLSGAPLAILFRYSCHTVTMGPRSNRISPDFAGPARQVIEQAMGCPTIFLQGCAGNLNPATGIGQDTNNDEDCVRLGQMLGGEVLKVCATLRTHRRRREPVLIRSIAIYWMYQYGAIEPGPAGRVAALEERLSLALAPFGSLADIEREREDWAARLRDCISRNAPESETNVAVRFDYWSSRRLAVARESTGPVVISFPIQVVQIGPLTLIALPFEPMSETGTRLTAAIDPDGAMVLGYSNGIVSYLPTPEVSAAGGMEARLGYKNYLLPAELPGDWEPTVVAAATRLASRPHERPLNTLDRSLS
jgi:hypothetical protein